MGLFNFFKKQLLKVVEWEDDSKDVIVYRYPLTDRDELMTSSTLVVRESQCAIFMHKGEIADVFGPGTYKLSTENIPFLTKILSLPSGFESKIKAEIYYVNTKQFIGQKWGTQNPIMMRDEEFGNVRVRGFGVYSFKVADPKVFMKEVFGTNAVYKTADVCEQIKPMLIQGITDALAEAKISALDLAANYREFSSTVLETCQKEFADYGLNLTKFVIENISLPEEVEKTLDERTKLGVLEDKMGTYTQKKAADALLDSANNPNGNNMAGLGVGLGAGVTMSNVFTNNLSTENKPREKKEKTITCSKCNATIKANAKFCSECGAKVENAKKFCEECGTELAAKAKFCPNCGKKQ
ncbi:MAG: SPFH domain-containing protein [Clostridia bacterium]|nr:SPFH domain-containing protein [Clostridia bacterium]